MVEESRKCTGCGCTEEKPCPSGCAWVRKDLCSECLPLEAQELSVMMSLLGETCRNMGGLPWGAFRQALDGPQALAALPPKLTPERRELVLRHFRLMAELAVKWKDLVVLMRAEMTQLGPALTVAGAADLPPEPPPGGLRIVRP